MILAALVLALLGSGAALVHRGYPLPGLALASAGVWLAALWMFEP